MLIDRGNKKFPTKLPSLREFSHGASKCFLAPKVPLALEFEFDRRAVLEASVFSATKHSCHSILDIYRMICLVVNENCFDDMMLVHPSLHVDCCIDVAIVHIPMTTMVYLKFSSTIQSAIVRHWWKWYTRTPHELKN
jgi:hypothetical protein